MPQLANQTAETRESLAAIGLMSSAMLIIPIMDIIAKYLSASLPPLEITFGRFFFQFLLCILIAAVAGKWQQLKSKHLAINLLRGTLLALASFCFFTAVKFMPVATAISIFFVEPMILTILAALILKEKFGPRRVVAIVIGLVGALLILRPSFSDVGPAALLPLCTALLFAFYLIINRRYAGADSLLAIQFSAGLAGSVILGTALLVGSFLGLADYAFVMPTGPNVLLLISIGAISFACHGLVVMAFQRGEASLLAPLNYIEIVSATLFGYLVFGDFPDTMTWIGISLIVGSGLYIAHRERATKTILSAPS